MSEHSFNPYGEQHAFKKGDRLVWKPTAMRREAVTKGQDRISYKTANAQIGVVLGGQLLAKETFSYEPTGEELEVTVVELMHIERSRTPGAAGYRDACWYRVKTADSITMVPQSDLSHLPGPDERLQPWLRVSEKVPAQGGFLVS